MDADLPIALRFILSHLRNKNKTPACELSLRTCDDLSFFSFNPIIFSFYLFFIFLFFAFFL